MQPLSIGISVLALFVSLGGVVWVQRRTDSREYAKWRRDTLTKTAVDLIKLSTQRSKYISSYITEFSSHKRFNKFDDQSGFMISTNSLLATIEICEAEALYIEVQKIISLHRQSDDLVRRFISDNATQMSPTIIDEIGNILGYLNRVDTLHFSLILETKKAVQ
ncbi:hypothetical protein [Rhodococcus sp. 077-4]|uniref:hypothetical protein n=1 Tax=Rhodococcus sp. 077-4 TaxID=2789271 RepID=UPI0039F54700